MRSLHDQFSVIFSSGKLICSSESLLNIQGLLLQFSYEPTYVAFYDERVVIVCKYTVGRLRNYSHAGCAIS